MNDLVFNYDELVIPGDWIPIFQKVLIQDGAVLVLGKSDSGKTSLIKALTYFLVKRNKKIGLIDLDVGQSTLGPPATIAMSTIDKEKLKDGYIPADNMLFVGMVSPARCMDRFLEKILKLYTVTEKRMADTILVDTTGLIMGNIGSFLKKSVIERIKPAILIALQFSQELEPILSLFEAGPSPQIYRIKPYQNIVQRSWRDRKLRREKQFYHYFQNSKLREVDVSAITIRDFNFGISLCVDSEIIGTIKQKFALGLVYAEKIKNRVVLILSEPQNIPGKDFFLKIKKNLQVEQIIVLFPCWFQYLVVSFNTAGGLSKGLGIISNIDFKKKKITIHSPVFIEPNTSTEVVLGQIRVRPDGAELPYKEPLVF